MKACFHFVLPVLVVAAFVAGCSPAGKPPVLPMVWPGDELLAYAGSRAACCPTLTDTTVG